MRPIDIVRERFTIVHGAPPKMRAKCPAHGSHGGTLSIAESGDGTVLLRCHAGCDLSAIVSAAGLKIGDLFPASDSLQKRAEERKELRRQYARAPVVTIREAIARGIEDMRLRFRSDLGYERPLTSNDINAVRRRVNEIFGTHLAAIAPFDWEFPPHCDDPAWPALFERARRMVMISKWGDPDREPTQRELQIAAVWAARDLRDLSFAGGRRS